MENVKLQPLDIVKTPGGGLAIVTEVCDDGYISIDYLNDCNPQNEKNSWWTKNDGLVLVDRLPRVISNALAHPFGSNKEQGDVFFPIYNEGCTT